MRHVAYNCFLFNLQLERLRAGMKVFSNAALPLFLRKDAGCMVKNRTRSFRSRPCAVVTSALTLVLFGVLMWLQRGARFASPAASRQESQARGVDASDAFEQPQDSVLQTGNGLSMRSSCAGEVVFFIRSRSSDFPERVQSVLSTWGGLFPPEDLFFVSGDPVRDKFGAQVIVEPRIGADPLYGRFPVHDPLVLGLAWNVLQQRQQVRFIMIIDPDTFVLPDNLCSYAIPEVSSGRSPYNDYVYSGFGVYMGPPWGANNAGTSCLEKGRAPRELPNQGPAGIFASGPVGVLLSRALVRDLAPYAEAIWNETQCIDTGDMRLWMGMYFHENDALQGKTVRDAMLCSSLTASGNLMSVYETLPPNHAVVERDFETFYATLPQTSPDHARILMEMFRRHQMSALSAADIMLEFQRLRKWRENVR
jgi:hypothetical protein